MFGSKKTEPPYNPGTWDDRLIEAFRAQVSTGSDGGVHAFECFLTQRTSICHPSSTFPFTPTHSYSGIAPIKLNWSDTYNVPVLLQFEEIADIPGYLYGTNKSFGTCTMTRHPETLVRPSFVITLKVGSTSEVPLASAYFEAKAMHARQGLSLYVTIPIEHLKGISASELWAEGTASKTARAIGNHPIWIDHFAFSYTA